MKESKSRINKQDIIDHLNWDDSVNNIDIKIEIEDNTVQLKGTVPNYTSKLAAERDVLQVSGVEKVENYLQVKFPPSVTIPNDHDIKENITKMLVWNNMINAENIEISVNRGTVKLWGSVESKWEKHMVESIVNSVHGVVDVENSISVKLGKSLLDKDIENDIKRAFERSILIDEDNISVNVKNSIVELSGSVANMAIKKEAFNTALYTAGVLDVTDNLTVK
ncbi:MAG: BON domain-containing protein [Bacteroidota bacterium]